jgi:hypothetical protein
MILSQSSTLSSFEAYLSLLKNMIMNLTERVASPTPKFFKTVRNISIVLAVVSGAILIAPIAMPVTGQRNQAI